MVLLEIYRCRSLTESINSDLRCCRRAENLWSHCAPLLAVASGHWFERGVGSKAEDQPLNGGRCAKVSTLIHLLTEIAIMMKPRCPSFLQKRQKSIDRSLRSRECRRTEELVNTLSFMRRKIIWVISPRCSFKFPIVRSEKILRSFLFFLLSIPDGAFKCMSIAIILAGDCGCRSLRKWYISILGRGGDNES